MTLTPQDLVEMYRLMLLGRRFTEHILKWYDEGRLPQGLHPSIGQEAVGVGACYGLRAGDWVLPSLRTSEAFFTRGVTMLQQLNAMLGNAASISRGKETSHHAGYPQNGILAGTGIVGGSIPVAVGAALGLRMRGADNVVLCFFGDGAANRGDFHEAINLAAVWKLPIVYVCQNNYYAISLSLPTYLAAPSIAERANGYGIPGEIVDGNDVLAVNEVVQAAVRRARAGAGPSLIEARTYRLAGHWAEDVASYRDPVERARWEEKDPLVRAAAALRATGESEAELRGVEAALKRDVELAFSAVRELADVGPAELGLDEVYAPVDFSTSGAR